MAPRKKDTPPKEPKHLASSLDTLVQARQETLAKETNGAEVIPMPNSAMDPETVFRAMLGKIIRPNEWDDEIKPNLVPGSYPMDEIRRFKGSLKIGPASSARPTVALMTQETLFLFCHFAQISPEVMFNILKMVAETKLNKGGIIADGLAPYLTKFDEMNKLWGEMLESLPRIQRAPSVSATDIEVTKVDGSESPAKPLAPHRKKA